MPRHDIFGGFWITQPKILPDTKVVSDTSVVEILCAEQPNKSFNQSSPFFPVGVFTLVKHSSHRTNKLLYKRDFLLTLSQSR